MSKTGHGSIFSIREGGQLTPNELLEAIASKSPAWGWTIDADDPMEFLRYVERVPLSIVRSNKKTKGKKRSWVQGVGACHLYYHPADASPVFADAISTIVQLGKLSRRFSSTHRSEGGLVAMAVQVGYLLAMLHARNFEYFAELGKSVDGNLAARRQGTPITAQAKRMFKKGKPVRDVAEACGVGYQVARRWRKLFLENR
jgi:hypothetical protein